MSLRHESGVLTPVESRVASRGRTDPVHGGGGRPWLSSWASGPQDALWVSAAGFPAQYGANASNARSTP